MREQKGKILAHFSLDFWASTCFFAYLPETVLRYYYILFDTRLVSPPSHQLIGAQERSRTCATEHTRFSAYCSTVCLPPCAPKQKYWSSSSVECQPQSE